MSRDFLDFRSAPALLSKPRQALMAKVVKVKVLNFKVAAVLCKFSADRVGMIWKDEIVFPVKTGMGSFDNTRLV